MTRVLHIASLAKTLELFCAPFEAPAAACGFEFAYLDSDRLGTARPLLRRGYAGVRSWPYARSILRRILATDSDVIHVHTPATALALLPALASVRVPKLYVARGGLTEGRGRLEQRVYGTLDPSLWRMWDHVAVLNSAQLRVAERRNSVPVSRVSAGGMPAPEARSTVPDGDPARLRLLWVGRMVEDKQPAAALRIAQSLHAAGYPVQLTFVGGTLDGDREARKLRRGLMATSIAKVVGWVDDVSPYYRDADLLLVTSRREGYGRTPLEAAAFGVPTVGYRTQGTSESIVDAGGWVVDQGDERGLENRVRGYWDASELNRRAERQRVLQHAQRMEDIDVWGEWRGIYESIL